MKVQEIRRPSRLQGRIAEQSEPAADKQIDFIVQTMGNAQGLPRTICAAIGEPCRVRFMRKIRICAQCHHWTWSGNRLVFCRETSEVAVTLDCIVIRRTSHHDQIVYSIAFGQGDGPITALIRTDPGEISFLQSSTIQRDPCCARRTHAPLGQRIPCKDQIGACALGGQA